MTRDVSTQEKGKVSEFETEPCPRCGGSGEYSRCETWGTACFSCGSPGKRGSGRRLTKRGRAAREFYLSLLPTKLVTALQPGDRIIRPGYKGLVVREVKESVVRFALNGGPWQERPGFDVHCNGIIFSGEPGDAVVKIVPTTEQYAEALAKALAYQETLTKAGTPRKVRGGAK